MIAFLKTFKRAVDRLDRNKYQVIVVILSSIIIEATLPLISILLISKIVTMLVSPQISPQVYIHILYYFILTMLPQGIAYAREKYLVGLRSLLTVKMEKSLLHKVLSTSIPTRNSIDFSNSLTRSEYSLVPGQIMNLIKFTSEAMVGLITCLVVLINLFVIHWSIAIVIVVLFFVTDRFLYKSNANYWSLIFGQSLKHRMTQSIESSFLSDNGNKELRILGHFGWLKEKWKATYKDLLREKWLGYVKSQTTLSSLNFTLSLIPLIVALLLTHFLNQQSTVQVIVLFKSLEVIVGYFFGFTNDLRASREAIIQFTETDKFLEAEYEKDQRCFLATKKTSSIEMSSVSFRYPNTENDALKNISLSIKAGNIVCVVGENGSGKTTLVNVMLGLYPAQTGNIRYDEGRVELPLASSMFQHFLKLKTTPRDNIVSGDVSDRDNNQRLERAINKASAEFIYTKGVDIQLGHQFGGIELSGGEWQKLALARAMYSEHNLVVFDEPTSAIDPLTEQQLYSKIINEMKGHTIILVSHRLSAATISDVIIVMNNGEIQEVGTHSELMNKKGKYYDMFTKQAQSYQIINEGAV